MCTMLHLFIWLEYLAIGLAAQLLPCMLVLLSTCQGSIMKPKFTSALAAQQCCQARLRAVPCAACSSSLVALNDAVADIHSGRVDYAMVGGASAIFRPATTVAFMGLQ